MEPYTHRPRMGPGPRESAFVEQSAFSGSGAVWSPKRCFIMPDTLTMHDQKLGLELMQRYAPRLYKRVLNITTGAISSSGNSIKAAMSSWPMSDLCCEKFSLRVWRTAFTSWNRSFNGARVMAGMLGEDRSWLSSARGGRRFHSSDP